ncbi:putative GNAT family N-acyltransferase [Paenibacillus cellulosilyticus]|uniref:Putative GNAT family N-acyltransferase n=1 Tax=Paenibacillus cellulosilyticus TaxID=375489 RepID=A0A2V2YZ32_9BACL|nr:GNAT family N-acetyltransferase [Paenibacillus cellulosilyticus]PWW07192.1 putative GNAT family N-acyltransferase [Paenibacillus cellulosilyticus]QKS44606.1 GNAT family N-acetyltransferase [Paenibacillus cellulosilyticus]
MRYAQRITLHEELETAFTIRKNVFVEEQGVPLADEFDQYDKLEGPCVHILAYYDGKPIGTGRIRSVEGIGKLERICILEPYRKFGIGKKIIAALEGIAVEQGLRKVKLHGQTQAKGFYTKLGYLAASEEFMEDGIPHILMMKDLTIA